MLDMVFWIIPLTSLVACLSTYGIAAGYDINIGFVMNLLVGVIFIIIGIFLPSIKQNYTVGIRLPWTLLRRTGTGQADYQAACGWLEGYA